MTREGWKKTESRLLGNTSTKDFPMLLQMGRGKSPNGQNYERKGTDSLMTGGGKPIGGGREP